MSSFMMKVHDEVYGVTAMVCLHMRSCMKVVAKL